jgi:hypothetical protein
MHDCEGNCGRRVPIFVLLCASCTADRRRNSGALADIVRERRLERRRLLEHPDQGPAAA